jgi:O-antigen ligase
MFQRVVPVLTVLLLLLKTLFLLQVSVHMIAITVHKVTYHSALPLPNLIMIVTILLYLHKEQIFCMTLTHISLFFHYKARPQQDGFGGPGVSALAFGTQVHRFKPG